MEASALATLYAHLEGAGLTLGVPERLRLEAVLAQQSSLAWPILRSGAARVATAAGSGLRSALAEVAVDDRERLRRIVAAVVVKSGEERPRFDRAFEEWWAATRPREPEPGGLRDRSGGGRWPGRRRWRVRARAALRRWWPGLPVVAAIVVWWLWPVTPTDGDGGGGNKDGPGGAGGEPGRPDEPGQLAEEFTTPEIVVRTPETAAAWPYDGALALLALVGLGLAFYRARYARPPFGGGTPPDVDAPLPPPLGPLPEATPRPRFVVGQAESTLVWGIGQFVSEELTERLDLAASVAATLEAGGVPTPRHQRARHHREVWLWLDDTAAHLHPEMTRFADEAATALRRAGLPVEIAWFSGLPASLDGRDGRRRLGELEDRRDTARVAVLTDGRDLRARLARGVTPPAVERVLRQLGGWPGLAFADFSRGTYGLAGALAPYGLPQVAPEGLAHWLGGESRAEAAASPDAAAWAGACALAPEPVDPQTALQLRDALARSGLRASAWALGHLPGARTMGGDRLGWPPAEEGRLIEHLSQMEEGPGSLMAAALDFWDTRLAAAAGTGGEAERGHREAQRALIALWRGPGPALDDAAEVLEAGRGALADGVRRRLGRLVPAEVVVARPENHPIRLPWRWDADGLSALTRERLRKAGLGAAVADLRPLDLKRAARAWVAVGLAAGVLLAAGVALVAAGRQAEPRWPPPEWEGARPPGWIFLIHGAPAPWSVLAGPPRDLELHANLPTGTRLSLGGNREKPCRRALPNGVQVWRCAHDPHPKRPEAKAWPRRSFVAIQGADGHALAAALLDRGAADVVAFGGEPEALAAAFGPLLSDDQAVLVADVDRVSAREVDAWNSALSRAAEGTELVPRVQAVAPRSAAPAQVGGEIRPLAEVWPGSVVSGGTPMMLGGDAEWCPYREETHEGITYVRVCAGTFTMGSAEDDTEAYEDEKPPRRVTISRDYWIGRTEVSNAQYRTQRKDHAPDEAPDLPAAGVVWNEARRFCEAKGGRLPTEAEWEYAARGRESRKYPWGGTPPDETRAVFGARAAQPVDSLPDGRGPFGALHQAGNAMEWVQDCHAPYTAGDTRDPVVDNEGCEFRVLRGGSFFFEPGNLRSAYRFRYRPEFRRWDFGFRCVRGARPSSLEP